VGNADEGQYCGDGQCWRWTMLTAAGVTAGNTHDAQHWRQATLTAGNADEGQCCGDGQYWRRRAILTAGNTVGGQHWRRAMLTKSNTTAAGNTDDGQHLHRYCPSR